MKRTQPTLEEQLARKCIHFNGIMNDTCDAVVSYASVTDDSRSGLERFPCFLENECVPCASRRFLTPEEAAAKANASRAHTAKTFAALAVVQEDAAAKGLKKGAGGKGQIKCPCCESGQLHYSVAGLNGHIWGKCSTPGCVAWMM